ncbi:MAG: iron-containing alcohol dehydrogenase [Armatimonas sp.]
MSRFDWQPTTRIVCEIGGLARLGELAHPYGTKALVVSDPGVVAAGHAARAQTILTEAGIESTLFYDTHENPTDEDVARCGTALQTCTPDLLIAIGGGSAIDTVKAANLVRGEPFLPLIAVPTTAGTGSEVQRHALLSDPKTHVKKAIGAVGLEPKIALLDAELTLTCPPRVTALAGMDALTHAIESQVSRTANSLSRIFSVEAFRLLNPALERVFTNPTDLEARADVLLGACWAGLAIENSMLGAAHASANPLTAQLGIVHGQAVSLMLPHVIRFNAAHADYASFGGAETLTARFIELLGLAGMATTLAEWPVNDAIITALAEDAAKQRTGLFNPRPLTEADFAALYQAATEPQT